MLQILGLLSMYFAAVVVEFKTFFSFIQIGNTVLSSTLNSKVFHRCLHMTTVPHRTFQNIVWGKRKEGLLALLDTNTVTVVSLCSIK